MDMTNYTMLRLSLTSATAQVLANGLYLLGIATTVRLVHSPGVEKEVKISYNIKVCPKDYIPAGRLIFYLL